MEQQLSPEAVEALAKSLAAKMESHKGATGRLTDQVVKLQSDFDKFNLEDTKFKQDMMDSLVSLKRVRQEVPIIALGFSLVAVLLATIGLIRTAQASQQMSQEIREIREHVLAEAARKQAEAAAAR